MENTKYLSLAAEKGAECGEFVASITTRTETNNETIRKAAVSFVNRLPLNNISFGLQLQSSFERAANLALRGLTEEEVQPLKAGGCSVITKPLPSAKTAEHAGAMAGLRHAESINARIAEGASILYDPWQAALTESKKGLVKFVRLADKIAYEHCFMATFRENFTLGEGR